MATVQHSVNLTEEYFAYDTRDKNWRMAVEKQWHVLDPVTLEGAKNPLYDTELRALSLNNLGIRIFYKIVVPLYFCENNGQNYDINTEYIADTMNIADNPVFQGNMDNITASFERCIFGVTGCKDTSIDARWVKPSRIISFNEDFATGAYALPEDQILNSSTLTKTDFATGRNVLNVFNTYINSNGNYLIADDTMNPNTQRFLMLNNSRVSLNDKINVNYTFDSSLSMMNLPYEASGSHYDSLMPLIFKPFGLIGKPNGLTLSSNDSELASFNKLVIAHPEDFIWYYCVLGVKDMTQA